MTSPTSATTDRGRRPPCGRPGRRGFTLIELLVVIGIITVLIGILSPMIMKSWQTANRVKLQADLEAVATALDARKADFGDYPRVTVTPPALPTPYDGAVVLCQSLLGPGDADDLDSDTTEDLGFRRRPGGKILPPYLTLDRFRIAHPTNPADTDREEFVFIDKNNRPILYFPASLARPNVRKAPIAPPAPYVDRSEFSFYDANDNLKAFDTTDDVALKKIRLMLGDYHGASGSKEPDGVIQTDEVPVDRPFLLWTAGPDELYGPLPETAAPVAELDSRDALKCDDVTNFRP